MSGRGRLFVFAGGGTGGHLAPGLALADELRCRESDCRIRFVGSGRPVEEQMLSSSGYERSAHDVLPLPQLRRRPLRFLRSHWRTYRRERAVMRCDRPAAVIGLGGYVSVPVILAAGREKVPVVLLEQNAIPGRANRLLARWFPICVTFDESRQRLPRGTIAHVTGNPLRPAIANLYRSIIDGSATRQRLAARTRTLLVVGGSLGSQQVNDSVVSALERIGATELVGWRVVHQTGPDGAESTAAAYERLGIEYVVQPFFPDLAELYGQTSLCIGRAGATTLTELAASAVPAILVPYPFAADDHQTANARIFEKARAAVVEESPDRSSQPVDLCVSLQSLMTDDVRLAEMRSAMLALARPDAAAMVADLLLEPGRAC